jgi:hypothetical protein
MRALLLALVGLGVNALPAPTVHKLQSEGRINWAEFQTKMTVLLDQYLDPSLDNDTIADLTWFVSQAKSDEELLNLEGDELEVEELVDKVVQEDDKATEKAAKAFADRAQATEAQVRAMQIGTPARKPFRPGGGCQDSAKEAAKQAKADFKAQVRKFKNTFKKARVDAVEEYKETRKDLPDGTCPPPPPPACKDEIAVTKEQCEAASLTKDGVHYAYKGETSLANRLSYPKGCFRVHFEDGIFKSADSFNGIYWNPSTLSHTPGGSRKMTMHWGLGMVGYWTDFVYGTC